MIKPLLKRLSFSFVALASAAILAASEQGPAAQRGAGDSARVGFATQADIDEGWQEQLAQVEKRLADKEAEGLLVPGAIITPPFETFAAYRTDVPSTLNASKSVKPSRRGAATHPSRD